MGYLFSTAAAAGAEYEIIRFVVIFMIFKKKIEIFCAFKFYTYIHTHIDTKVFHCKYFFFIYQFFQCNTKGS